jgi:hypothetical protein
MAPGCHGVIVWQNLFENIHALREFLNGERTQISRKKSCVKGSIYITDENILGSINPDSNVQV